MHYFIMYFGPGCEWASGSVSSSYLPPIDLPDLIFRVTVFHEAREECHKFLK